MAEGNRKDPRARVLNMTVRYKSATVDEFIENHSHDISKGGIFIKTRAPFPAGTLLKFEVRIAEDQRLMQGVGRVVWRREPERAEEGFPAGMGIKFIKTGEGAAELIAQIIAAREGQESSFDAGVRAGLEAEGPRSDGGARPSAPPSAAVEASHPPADGPSLQVESGPLSMPVDGEFRVSSPAKKRQGQVSETRKVVLQGAAFGAPSSDKPPAPVPARIVAAQDERAPNREAPPAKERSSIVDETTSPRARSSADPHSARTKESSNPSVLGLVAILGAIGLTVFLVNRIRGPEEAAAPEASTVTTSAPPAAAPPAPLTAPPVLPTPPPETGEGAPSGDVGATATAPSTSLGSPPSAGLGAPATAGSGTPSAATPPAVTAPPVTVPPATAPAASSAKPALPPVAVPKPVAPKPKPAVTAKPAAPAKPKPDAAPAEKPTGEASIRPAGEPEPTPPTGSTAPAATAKPAEAKKTPPAAATPPAAEPAPSPPNPKEPPSDDNPY